MLYILLIFTCSGGNFDLMGDSCTIEPTVYMDITYEECERQRTLLQPSLVENQLAVCVEQDTE